MSDAAALFFRLNLAAAGAVLLALLLRPLVRRAFGARTAYLLWWLAPAAVAAMLAPARVITVLQVAPTTAVSEVVAATPAPPMAGAAHAVAPFPWIGALWLAGVVLSAAWLALGQWRFMRAMRAGRAGPAVVGVLRPRIVTPDDFETLYTARERQLILAHEQRHIDRHDPRVNALVAAAQCLAWFNPLVHLLAHFLRVDQELACDAAVIDAQPKGRRAYAEAMLKTQLAAQPLPLGCHWPATAAEPLAFRIALLARPQPSTMRRIGGGGAVLMLAAAFAAGAWAARPPILRSLIAPPPAVVAAPIALPPSPAARPAPNTPAAQPALAAAAAAPARTLDEAPAPIALPPQPVADPPAEFRVRTVTRPSFVEPGSAVRVVATLTRADGRRMTTDLTAFGSQQAFRTGYYERDDDRRSLFTSVEQHGDRLFVTVSLGKRFEPASTGTILLRPGETGTLRLPSSETVTVSAFVRAETEAELNQGDRWARERAERERDAADRQRHDMERRRILADLDPGTFRCGRIGAIC